MINQYELSGLLCRKLPEFSGEWGTEQVKNPYKAMKVLVHITARKVREHDLTEVKRCFEIVDFLYERGNNIIKNAVENVYVYAFSHVLFSVAGDRSRILSIIPVSLYTLYINQLKSSGC